MGIGHITLGRYVRVEYERIISEKAVWFKMVQYNIIFIETGQAILDVIVNLPKLFFIILP